MGSTMDSDRSESVRKKLYLFVENVINGFHTEICSLELILKNRNPKVDWLSFAEKLAKALPGLLSAAPVGPAVGLSVDLGLQSYRYFDSKTNHKRAKELAALIYHYRAQETELKTLIIQACIALFLSYEMQFVNCYVDANDNNRALGKLASDAVYKILNNYIKEKPKTVTVTFIRDSVTLAPDGKVLQFFKGFTAAPPYKRTVNIDSKTTVGKISTNKFYCKVGVFHGNKYYNTPSSKTRKYGYRRPFKDEELPVHCVSENNQFIDYSYAMEDLDMEHEVAKILEYLKERKPDEMAERFMEGLKKTLNINVPKDEIVQQLFISFVLPCLMQNLPASTEQTKMTQVPWFQMKGPAFNFIGRMDFMDKMLAKFDSGVRVLTISGLSGVGKSDLCRKYCERNRETYHNIIWIDSETKTNLDESMSNLAVELDVPLQKNASPRSILEVVKDIYSKIKTFKSVVIFDNVTTYKSIEDYLPGTDVDVHVIITSVNEYCRDLSRDDWIVLPLSVLSPNESVEFINTTLEKYTDVETDSNTIVALAQTLEYLPLALQQAVACIIDDVKIGIEKPTSNYVKNYTSLLNKTYIEEPFPDNYRNSYKKTVFGTMQLSFNKMQDPDALHLLRICSFLNPERITISLLCTMYEEMPLKRALRNLEMFSLATIENNVVKFHRLVLEISRQVYSADPAGRAAYQEVLGFVMECSLLSFCTRRIDILPSETLHTEFIFRSAETYWETVFHFYKQQTEGRKIQLFFLLVYYGCFGNLQHIVEDESKITLSGNLVQHFEEEIVVVDHEMKRKKDKNIQFYDKNQIVNKYEGPASIVACFAGHIEILKLLLTKGADINGKHKFGCSLLHGAACTGHLEIVQHLIGAGAVPDITDNDGSSILHAAVSYRQVPTIRYLLDKDVIGIDVRNDFGDTVLHIASCFGYTLPIEKTSEVKRMYISSIMGLRNMIGSFVSAFIEHKNVPSWSLDISNAENSRIHLSEIAEVAMSETLTGVALSELPNTEEILKLFIERGVDIEVKNKFGCTPLHLASACGLFESASILVNNGARVDVKDNDDMSPLHYASAGGFLRIVQLLLENQADVNAREKSGFQPLHFTSHKGHFLTSQCLLNHSTCEVNALGRDDITPLHEAASVGQAALVGLLLERNANILATDKNGFTVLHWCLGFQKPEHSNETHRCKTVELLIEKGVHVNALNDKGESALLLAVVNGYESIAELLIDRGADISVIDNNSRTLLHISALLGRSVVTKKLLDKGVANTFDVYGRNALMYASNQGHKSIVELLTREKVNLNEYDREGFTALHLAASTGNLEVMKLLEEADLEAEMKSGLSVLQVAACYGRTDAVKYLIRKHVKLNTAGKDGRTALHLAANNGHTETVKLLVKHANIFSVTNAGETILHLAVANSHYDTATFILTTVDKIAIASENKKDFINKTNNLGYSALHVACKGGNVSMVRLLLDNDADTKTLCNEGELPLNLAFLNGHEDIVEMLLDYDKIHLANE